MFLKVGKFHENDIESGYDMKKKNVVLILGAGRVCRPAAEFLTSIGSVASQQVLKSCMEDDFEEQNCVEVIVASLYLKDAEEVCGVQILVSWCTNWLKGGKIEKEKSFSFDLLFFLGSNACVNET